MGFTEQGCSSAWVSQHRGQEQDADSPSGVCPSIPELRHSAPIQQNLGTRLRLCHEQTWGARSGDLCTVRLGQRSTATSWDYQEEVEALASGSRMSWEEGRNY